MKITTNQKKPALWYFKYIRITNIQATSTSKFYHWPVIGVDPQSCLAVLKGSQLIWLTGQHKIHKSSNNLTLQIKSVILTSKHVYIITVGLGQGQRLLIFSKFIISTSTLLQYRALSKSSVISFLLLACRMN